MVKSIFFILLLMSLSTGTKDTRTETLNYTVQDFFTVWKATAERIHSENHLLIQQWNKEEDEIIKADLESKIQDNNERITFEVFGIPVDTVDIIVLKVLDYMTSKGDSVGIIKVLDIVKEE